MASPQFAPTPEPGVHVWPDPFDRGWVFYYLVLDDGRLAQERRMLAELDDEVTMGLAKAELAQMNARLCASVRKGRHLALA